MSVFGEVAAGLSLTIQAFDGCIKGFVLLSAAQNFGRDAEVLVCQLDWEHYCLSRWARLVGLFGTPPKLDVTLPSLVHQTLRTLEQLLTDTQKLRVDYGLDICVTEEEVTEVSVARRGFGKLIDRTRPSFVSETARSYSRSNSAWRKVKWGAFDAEKFRGLLKDIRFFNERLQMVLSPTHHYENLRQQEEVMRSVVAKGPDKRTLDAMVSPLGTVSETVAASARLRGQGLSLNLIPASLDMSRDVRGPSTQSNKVRDAPIRKGPKDMRKRSELLADSHGHASLQICREVAIFEGNATIVEWKDIADHLEPRLKHRVANVAAFLAEMSHPSFHTLRCTGYIKASTGRYAYLFDPPLTVTAKFKLKSLTELLLQSSSHPSLDKRIEIGVAIAETVLQLHTAGLLHKGIRPDNVFFFYTGLENSPKNEVIGEAYLGGYEFARVDNPLETTEDPSASTLDRLYRHPESLGYDRVSYNKAFDLHSLGCLLIELGLWQPLSQILWKRLCETRALHGLTPNETDILSKIGSGTFKASQEQMLLEHKHALLSETSSDSIMATLDFVMGSAYKKIVHDCLQSEKAEIVNAYDDDECESPVKVQESIVSTLKKMQEALQA